MLAAIIAILSGILLLSGLWRGMGRNVVRILRPFEGVIGVIAVVVGILNIFSLLGISLIIAGLILGAQALQAVPGIGESLERAGSFLAQFGVIVGLIVLVIGLVRLVQILL